MNTRLTTLAVLACAACFTSAAHALCQMSPETNAFSVQNDSGQGNYDCSVLQSPDGNDLIDVSSLAKFTPDVGTGAAGETVKWQYPDPADGASTRYPVYFVSTNNSGQGKRCNYLYDGAQVEGEGLGAFEGAITDVTVCADPEPVAVQPVQTNIFDTQKDQCLTTVAFDESTQTVEPNVTLGFSSGIDGQAQTITICGNTDDVDLLLPGSNQLACTPPPYVQQTPTPPAEGTCEPYADGSIPLSCAPVDISGAPLVGPEYCWYYENRVCETGSTDAYCSDPTRNSDNFPSYIPRTKIDSFPVQIDVFRGSPFCYTTYFYGVAYITCYPLP